MSSAVKLLGTPSVQHKDRHMLGDCTFGTDPREGLDCSGLIVYSLKQIGIHLSPELRHSCQMFENLGNNVSVGEQKKGDLVFFSRGGRMAAHVGIMLSHDEYIHAPGQEGTKVTVEKLFPEFVVPLKSKYRSPQVFFHNPIGFRRLTNV